MTLRLSLLTCLTTLLCCPLSYAQDHAAVVDELVAMRDSAAPAQPFSQRGIEFSIDQAYDLQLKVMEHLDQAGAKLAGYKCAFTSTASQERWKVPSPCAGPLYWSDITPHGATLDASTFSGFHIEAEIAFVLKETITSVPDNPRDLDPYVASVHLSFDIPDLRYDKSNGLPTAPDLIADGMAARGWTLGTGIDPATFDPNVTVNMYRDNELYSSAPATAALGDPWNALAWLAQLKIEHGQPLQAGHVILTGTLGKAYVPQAGENPSGEFTAKAEGLGWISVKVASPE